MASREQVLKEAAEKREYLKTLVVQNPGGSAALLLGMVHQKFGSGVSPRTLQAIREELKAEAKAQQKSAQAPAAAPTPAPEDDERLEVQLIAQLQGLMRRQGYQAVYVPLEGNATIRMLVVREKLPGEHVEAALH